jgi:argininosuccinate lyase
MMPQKRNPDVAELTRGRAAVTVGELTSLLSLLKSQPLAYNRDLQEDKPLIFGTVKRTAESLEAMNGLVGALEFDEEAMQAAASGGGTWATDVAEALVRRGMPFREAHQVTGRLVAEVERTGGDPASVASSAHPDLRASDVPGSPLDSITARSSRGGPAPEKVLRQIEQLREKVAAVRPNR